VGWVRWRWRADILAAANCLYISGFWGAPLPDPTGAPPLDPLEDLRSGVFRWRRNAENHRYLCCLAEEAASCYAPFFVRQHISVVFCFQMLEKWGTLPLSLNVQKLKVFLLWVVGAGLCHPDQGFYPGPH